MDNQVELQVLAKLTELVELAREIRDLLRTRLPEPPPADSRLEALLRTAATALEEDSFSAVTLAETAVSSFPGAAALGKAIVAITGKNVRIRKLGHFLSRQAGRTAGGLRLVRLKERSRSGPLYRLQDLQVSNLHNLQRATGARQNISNVKEQ